MKNLKESNPIELAEYAVANRIDGEPAFKWWCKDVLKRRDRYVSKVKSRYWKTSHKIGVRLPHSVEEALGIDRDTCTNHWMEAIKKEMLHVRPEFQPWDGTVEQARSKTEGLVGNQEIKCYMIFEGPDQESSVRRRWSYNGYPNFDDI